MGGLWYGPAWSPAIASGALPLEKFEGARGLPEVDGRCNSDEPERLDDVKPPFGRIRSSLGR